MTWGCKQKPNGCGWATRLTHPGGTQEWWCDTCERAGLVAPAVSPTATTPDEPASRPAQSKGQEP